MKAIKLITGLGLTALLLTACGTSKMSGPGYYYDDIYYSPGKSRESTNQAFSAVPSMSNEALKAEKKEQATQKKEYEKRNRESEQRDTRDFSAIQEEYSSLLRDESITELDTLIYYNDETGYWVGGFSGSQIDRDYAERLIRFHGPTIRVSYYSPLYSELVYFNHYDWNVYVDGYYAYAVPTWTNRWYDYYYYGGGWHRPHYGFGYSWGYNSWYFNYGWGYPYYYGYPYHYGYPYYYGYYGWGYPYYYGYWGHHHHGHYYGYNNKSNNYYGPRQGMGSSTRPVGGRDINTNARLPRTEGNLATLEGGRIRENQGEVTTTPRTRENNTATTREISGGQSVVTNDNTRVTRNSYTPSYSNTQETVRPTYNRAEYSRVNEGTRTTQTTGTVRTQTTGTVRPQTTGTVQNAQPNTRPSGTGTTTVGTQGNQGTQRPGTTTSGTTTSGSTTSGGTTVSRPSGTTGNSTVGSSAPRQTQPGYQQGSSSNSNTRTTTYSTGSSSSSGRSGTSNSGSSSTYRSNSSSSSGSSYSSGSSGSSSRGGGSSSSGSSGSSSSGSSRGGGSSSSGGRR